MLKQKSYINFNAVTSIQIDSFYFTQKQIYTHTLIRNANHK